MLLIMAVMAGCGPSAQPFYGEWKGVRDVGMRPETPPDVRNSLRKVLIDIREDGTATVVLTGLAYSGTWRGTSPMEISLTHVLDRPLPEAERQVVKMALDPKPTALVDGLSIPLSRP